MIYGKTTQEINVKRQEFLKRLKTTRIKCFALFPIELHDGKYVWFQYCYADYSSSIFKDYHLEHLSSDKLIPVYYLTSNK